MRAINQITDINHPKYLFPFKINEIFRLKSSFEETMEYEMIKKIFCTFKKMKIYVQFHGNMHVQFHITDIFFSKKGLSKMANHF